MQKPLFFFCLGKNVEKHPELFEALKKKGHTVGNHSYSHLNGWKTNCKSYLSDIEKGAFFIPSPLFRPPYGKITPLQYARLIKNYKIIMWTKQFADYSNSFKPPQEKKLNYTPGDILVMHDSDKTVYNTLPLLKNC